MTTPQPDSTLDGLTLRRLFVDAGALLQRHVDALNAINVFPVPDGDTGTNMHLTLRSGLEEMARSAPDDAGAVMRAAAHGTLMGARGNSGVILSQILHGFDVASGGQRTIDAAALREGFSAARFAAYEALSEPREGTILTVIREAAEAVENAPALSVSGVLEIAAATARKAVDRTPELLPVLKEAGVVDAGGLGLAIILEGLLRSLRGEPLDIDLAPQVAVEESWRSDAASLHRAEHGESGYCTEFVVSGAALDRAAAAAHLAPLGTSLLVVGGDELLRVHLHTTQPDDAIAYGRSLGDISRVKVDNLEAQIRDFATQAVPPPISSNFAVVAVAAGAGVEAAFRSMGVTGIIRGGQTMNPSAGEMLAAIEAAPARDVIVLPNNKNIVAAAQQAAGQTAKRVAVIPTKSIPDGVAAALAMNAELSLDENATAMKRALTSVRSAEVTRTVRATTIDRRHVGMGQAIGLVDGALRVVADDVASAARQCVNEMLSPEASLLTVYAGEDVREADSTALVAALRERHRSLEVVLVQGGQPHYPYILSLE
jgi:uncharacterized protein